MGGTCSPEPPTPPRPPPPVVPRIILAQDGREPHDSEEGPVAVQQKLHRLVEAFQRRTDRTKASITQASSPESPSSDDVSESDERHDHLQEHRHQQRLSSLVPDMASRPDTAWQQLAGVKGSKATLKRLALRVKKHLVPSAAIEPTSRIYLTWLSIANACYIYNAITIPLRAVFSSYQTEANLRAWFACDYFCDAIYVLDILLFNFRVKFIDNGFWVGEPKQIRLHYAKSTRFKLDLLALLPLDLFYIIMGPTVILRLPRLIKIHVFWDCFNRLDSYLPSPYIVRLTRTVLYMLYMIHLNCCAYYAMSKFEGIGSNSWVFSGEGHSYIRCFYFATKTVTSIGKNPRPANDTEHLFMTVSWLLGVFIFALLIGQIRDIMATATRAQTEYRAVMDATQNYLHKLNLPASLQERIKIWFTYTWHSQKTLNENEALGYLPKKMRTDVALSVHIHTLAKVQLFQDCDKALLRDLVLKLQPVIYLPGDLVCKKGEVGKEMYIVQSGQVQVVGGPDNATIFATLGEGSVFGEVSLLAVGGGNRRTADVKSRGFSNLFVLSKADLHETIRDYPQAQEVLRKKARRLLKQTIGEVKQKVKPEDDVLIKEREGTPKLMRAVLQAVRQDSFTASVIRRSSRSLAPHPPSASISPCPLHSPTRSISSMNNLLNSSREELALQYEEGLRTNATPVVRSVTATRRDSLAVPCLGCREDEQRRAVRDSFELEGHSETENIERGELQHDANISIAGSRHEDPSFIAHEREENIDLRKKSIDDGDIKRNKTLSKSEDNLQLEAPQDGESESCFKKENIVLRPCNVRLSNPVSLTPIDSVWTGGESARATTKPYGTPGFKGSCYVIHVDEAADNKDNTWNNNYSKSRPSNIDCTESLHGFTAPRPSENFKFEQNRKETP